MEEEELARFSFFHQLQTEIFQSAYVQHKASRLDDDIYRLVEKRSLGAFESSLWVSLWNAGKGGYLDDFVVHVDRMLAPKGSK